jgi:Flp pilus assembly protein TadD
MMAAGLELMFRKARSAEKRGDEAEARRLLEEVLASYPKNATARQALARLGDATRMAPTPAEIGLLVAAHRRGDQAETVRLGDALTARFATIDGVRTLTGAARLKLHDFAGAELDFRLEIQTEPHETGHHNHLGVALMGLGRLDEAETALAEALALDPDNIDALLNMALLYEGRGKYDEATEFCETVLRIKPGHLRGLQKLAEVQVVTKQFNPAIATYFKILADDPEHGGALHGIGRALMALNRHEQAVDSLRLAARVDPDSFDIHSDLGQALSSLGRFEQAIVAFATAAGICPDHYAVWGRLLALQAYLCDWTSRDALSTLPIDTAHMGIPFDALTFEDEPVRQLRRAEVYARHHFPDCYAPFVAPVRKPGGRIRIGYLSADFYNHATIFLMAGLFREHDRSRFEIRCYDFSPNGAATSVLDDHVDAMIDIRGMSDREAIDRIRADELDIAIDLKGYTRDSRAHILAARVAPLQVSYLGYPGSVGMEAMDYILADPVVIPHGFEDGYSEKILRLPGSYQPNDDQRTISATNDDRKSLGLPETGFVFCCFNQGYKIGPREFDLPGQGLVEITAFSDACDQPVVERPMVLELQRADRVGDVLDGVRLAVGEIVARIDVPGVAGARMVGMQNAIEHGIAQVDVARGHVDLRPQHPRAVRELAGAHAREQVEVLLHRAVAVRAVATGLGQRAAAQADLLLGLVVDIGLAGPDQVLRPGVELLEIIGSKVQVRSPVEAEPAHVALDGVDVFLLLLGRVGIVEPQVAAAAELLGNAEVEADRLGMPEVEVAVGLRREARHHTVGLPGSKVVSDNVADEVAAGFRSRFVRHRIPFKLRPMCQIGGPAPSARRLPAGLGTPRHRAAASAPRKPWTCPAGRPGQRPNALGQQGIVVVHAANSPVFRD